MKKTKGRMDDQHGCQQQKGREYQFKKAEVFTKNFTHAKKDVQ